MYPDYPIIQSKFKRNHIDRRIFHSSLLFTLLNILKDYLTSVDELSHQNRRNVLRQITKLHTGEGITYESKAYGWQEGKFLFLLVLCLVLNCIALNQIEFVPLGCYFMKGKKIGPTDDIIHLMGIAQTCEDDWGQDRGNGWLLRHPLKKLYTFQQYCLR